MLVSGNAMHSIVILLLALIVVMVFINESKGDKTKER